MRLHRMIFILLLIESKGKVKARDVAFELETSVRTVYRDIEALSEAGIPIVSSTGPNGGIEFIEGYSLGIKQLKTEDIVNLYLGSMGIKADDGTNMASKLNSALIRLQKNLSKDAKENLNTVKRRFFVDDTPWWGEKTGLNNIDLIMESIWKLKKLKIAYKKSSGDLSYRIIRPYGIVVKDKEWYMAAYCENSKALRIFKCDRIMKCRCLEEDFVLPMDFFVEDFWNKNKQKFIMECSERESYPVNIKIKKSLLYVLKNYQIYNMEEKDEYVFATINMYKYEFAIEDIAEILYYGEIINPAELRDYAALKLKSIKEYYDKN
ncbi:YafY family transcriptional regulator [Clostridium sp. 19966]|uniref:helix-turn-helix transcriptional regulator n=1 Tax=Clostridium sp. 19966 TaxID=2768166 RepID=UPI0028DFDCD6|nr:YafY family protein [Clostridium sp. 19966]MDT8717409.1 YafY family transcriptional regulator [Clostridium sp. 19966]